MKLNIGCGDLLFEGYTNIDLHSPNADIKADARNIPFEDNSVDEIINSHVIEHFHFHDAFIVLKEWYRVLKPGGILITETPNLKALAELVLTLPDAELPNIYAQLFGKPWMPGHAHYFVYTPIQFEWTLQNVGFINIQQHPALFYQDIVNRCMRFICQKPIL